MSKMLKAKEAEYGQKMIEIKVRFWTNDIADVKGKILPKHALDKGVVRVSSNRAHGLKTSDPIAFNSLMEITSAIERCILNSGITLRLGAKSKKYLRPK